MYQGQLSYYVQVAIPCERLRSSFSMYDARSPNLHCYKFDDTQYIAPGP